MLRFISENLGSIIVGAVVLAILVAVSVKLLRDKKSGKSSCACGGCEGCPSAGICHRDKPEQ